MRLLIATRWLQIWLCILYDLDTIWMVPKMDFMKYTEMSSFQYNNVFIMLQWWYKMQLNKMMKKSGVNFCTLTNLKILKPRFGLLNDVKDQNLHFCTCKSQIWTTFCWETWATELQCHYSTQEKWNTMAVREVIKEVTIWANMMDTQTETRANMKS